MKFIGLLVILATTGFSAAAQQQDVWIQYSLADGSQTGTNSRRVSDSDLAALGKGQVEYPGDPTGMMVDVTQHPPAVIPALQDSTASTVASMPCNCAANAN